MVRARLGHRQQRPRLFRADRISRPTVLGHTFVPWPSDLVTGVCPDARPTTTKTGAGHYAKSQQPGPEHIDRANR